MSCDRRAHRVERRDLQDPRVVEVDDALVLVLLQAALRARRGPAAPYLVNTSRLRTFSARSRRVSGGWSKATWQIRSKGSRSLPTSSASGSSSRPSLASSSMIACLRSAAFQRLRKSSRLAKRFCSAFLVKSRRLSVTSLPFSSRYSTRSATMRHRRRRRRRSCAACRRRAGS